MNYNITLRLKFGKNEIGLKIPRTSSFNNNIINLLRKWCHVMIIIIPLVLLIFLIYYSGLIVEKKRKILLLLTCTTINGFFILIINLFEFLKFKFVSIT